MNKELINSYLKQSIQDDKSLGNSIKVLHFILVLVSAILIIISIALMTRTITLIVGISIFVAVFVNYFIFTFLIGAGKALLNIQRSVTVTMLNTSSGDKAEYFELLNNSMPIDIKTEANKNMSEILEDENR